jgi:transmembrane sensor
MIPTDKDDIWEAAWQWAQYPVHETPVDHQDMQRLNAWLSADPLHRQAYDKAAHLWLMTGFIPRTTDE